MARLASLPQRSPLALATPCPRLVLASSCVALYLWLLHIHDLPPPSLSTHPTAPSASLHSLPLQINIAHFWSYKRRPLGHSVAIYIPLCECVCMCASVCEHQFYVLRWVHPSSQHMFTQRSTLFVIVEAHGENSAVSTASASEYLKAHTQNIPGFMCCPLSALRAQSWPGEDEPNKTKQRFQQRHMRRALQ